MAVKYITGGTADVAWANQNRNQLAQNLGTNDFQIVTYDPSMKLDNSYMVLGGEAAEGGVGAGINLNGANRIAGANLQDTIKQIGGYRDYNQLATNQINPQMNNQIALLNSALNNKIQAIESQRGGINQNYDIQAEDSSINTDKARNNYNTNIMSRGLGRSTIAATGTAGIQNQGNRILNNIETYRTNAMKDIDSNIALNKANTTDQITALKNSSAQQILALAQQLQQGDYQTKWNEDERTYQRGEDAEDDAYRQQMYQLSLLKAQDSGSNGSNSNNNPSKPNYQITTDGAYTKQQTAEQIINANMTAQDKYLALKKLYDSILVANTNDEKYLKNTLLPAAMQKVVDDLNMSYTNKTGTYRATGFKPAQ